MPGNVPLPASHEQAYKVGVSLTCMCVQGHMPWAIQQLGTSLMQRDTMHYAWLT